MTGRLHTRVAAQENRRAPPPPVLPFCCEMRIGESVDDALRRHADTYGRTPGQKRHVVLAPPALSAEQWLSEYGWSDDIE